MQTTPQGACLESLGRKAGSIPATEPNNTLKIQNMEENKEKPMGRMVIVKKVAEYAGTDFFDEETQKAVHEAAPCMVLLRDERGQVANVVMVED